MSLHAGAVLTHPDTGEHLVLWSPAPGVGCYWAQVLPHPPDEPPRVVKIRVRHPRHAADPVVTILDESA